MQNDKNVALVLSSGGARGIAHIGVIEELEARGYTITAVSGTSIGAVIGGFYAAGKLDAYRDWVCGLDRFNVFNLIDFTMSTKGVIKGVKVFKKMSEWMEGVNFEDLRIPFSCVAVDLLNRKEVVFDSGDVMQAMRASIAIPGYLEPLIVDGRSLYDGGIINPIPINRVDKSNADMVIAVDLNAYQPTFDPKKHWKEDVEASSIMKRVNDLWHSTSSRIQILQRNESNEKQLVGSQHTEKTKTLSRIGALNQMFELMQEGVAREMIRRERPDLLIEIPGNLCNTFEFHRSKELVEFGRLQTQKALDKFKDY